MNRLGRWLGQDATAAVPATPATAAAVEAAAPAGLIAGIGLPGLIVIGALVYFFVIKKPDATPIGVVAARRRKARKARRNRR